MNQPSVSEHNVMTELQWVHGIVRQDLQTCQDLAVAVSRGAPAAYVSAQVRRLETSGPLFQLRVNCLQYCRFVHHHHTLEDAALFPSVRKAAPQLSDAVDKLEADHREVSDLLDLVEAATGALAGEDSATIRSRLVQALDVLATRLLEHLSYEETVLAPVLTKWKQVPNA